jgi:hypothetical protein
MTEIRRVHPDDIEAIALAFSRSLQQARSVSDSEHFDHHKWVGGRIQAELERERFWRQMSEHAAKWGMLCILSAGAYALYLGARMMLKLPI